MDPDELDSLKALSSNATEWTTDELILLQPNLPPIDISPCLTGTPSTPKEATGDGAKTFNQPREYPNERTFLRLSYQGVESADAVIKCVRKGCHQAGFRVNCRKVLNEKIPKIYVSCNQYELIRDARSSVNNRKFSGPMMSQVGARHETVKRVSSKNLDAVERMQSKSHQEESRKRKGKFRVT